MQSKDGEDHEDKKPFESRKPNISMDDISNHDIVESDVELDDSDIMEPDNDSPQKMGDPSVEVIEENQEAAQLSKAKAMEAIADASIFIKMKKPNAAIQDANVALQVEPNAKKLEEHHRKYERLHKEKEFRRIELERKRRQDAEAASVLKDAASKSSRLSVLYFNATWSGPCRYVSPVFTSLAGKYPKVVFLKVDIDEARDAAAEWNISSVPAFFFVRNGKEVDQLIGADKNALEQKIAQHA